MGTNDNNNTFCKRNRSGSHDSLAVKRVRSLSRGDARALRSEAWQAERASILAKRCLTIDAARERGDSIENAVRRICRALQGRCYRCDQSRRIRISRSRMRSIYFAWIRAGRSPSVFNLKYATTAGTAGFKLSADQIARAHALMLDRETTSFTSIRRAFGESVPLSLSRFYDLFTPAIRRAARKIFLSRHAQRRAERAFAEMLSGKVDR